VHDVFSVETPRDRIDDIIALRYPRFTSPVGGSEDTDRLEATWERTEFGKIMDKLVFTLSSD